MVSACNPAHLVQSAQRARQLAHVYFSQNVCNFGIGRVNPGQKRHLIAHIVAHFGGKLCVCWKELMICVFGTKVGKH
jgi:hypothetical protein